ncbi:uncharacterized protein LOC131658855 [Vicia villosa]|uniref:uncharacterized protein LOC131658855 n=1 Tax=Vicia villosa TaxID=3911 RepID=UPI00273B0B2C|nr:uncharacterized protein LOC131658855 [Vicia villosa]
MALKILEKRDSEYESEFEEDFASEDKSELESSEGDSESEEESKDELEYQGDSTSKDESELESSEGKSNSEGDSEDESEGDSEDESDGEFDSDSDSDDDPESGGGTSEDRASEGNPASDGGHDSERKDYEVGTSEGRASEGDPTSKGGGFEQDLEVNKGGTSDGSQTSEENLEGDMVPESEGDSELLGIEEALEEKGCLNAIKEELEALEGNKTWKLTKLPKEKKTISVRWVFKEKSAFLNGVSEVAHYSNQKKLADVLMKDVKTEHLIRLRDGISVVSFD